MQITKDKVVSIDYTLTDPAGKVLDSSKGRQPLPYIHGGGNLIPGLEKALEGKSAGDALEVTIAPEDAYGLRDESLKQKMPRSAFQGVKRLEVGMRFNTQGRQGPQSITVMGFEGAHDVIVDANHPLAGVTLKFDVKIIEVRDATPDELAHGHVHGPGGHHHH